MNNHSIGIFDSGIGGLTVVRQVMKSLPGEDIVYFGDTARVPYGIKSKDVIVRYSIEDALFLIEQKIKLLVIACNTASAYACSHLQGIFKIPVIGVIEPGIDSIVEHSKSHRIGIVGTAATIGSGAYQAGIKARLPEAEIMAVSCPLFVPFVEEGMIDHPATKMMIQEYLSPLKGKVDTLLLACTHYPLLKASIKEFMGDNVTLIDSAHACAKTIAELLTAQDLLSTQHKGNNKFFVSDDPDKFCRLGRMFLQEEINNVNCIEGNFQSCMSG